MVGVQTGVGTAQQPVVLANTQIEYAFQPRSSCMTCHSIASVATHFPVQPEDNLRMSYVNLTSSPPYYIGPAPSLGAYKSMDFLWSLEHAYPSGQKETTAANRNSMSILSLPRVHFNGSTDWSPSTANNHNNVYDVSTVAPVLQTGVTYTTFLKWLKTLNPGSSGVDVEVWGSWNVYGDHAVRFTNASIHGVQLSSKAIAATDPLLGCAINIYGLR